MNSSTMESENRESSLLRQVGVCLTRCMRSFRNENGWKQIVSVGLITILIASVTGDELFVTFKATRNGCFALVCACIWTGIFNSIRSVCRERDIIRREHRTGLRMSAYVMAHMIYEGLLSMSEALVATLLTWLVNRSHFMKGGVIFPAGVEMWIEFFLIIYAADVMAMMISSIVTNENTAMTVMPFALIIQMIFSGTVFELEGIAEKFSHLTIARWGMNALSASSDVNRMSFISYYKELESTPINLGKAWLILLAFAIVYGVLSWIALLNVDRY